MNLKILQWLLAHRDVLTKVLEVVKGFRKDLPAMEQWEIADKVARLVIPVLTKEDIRAMEAISWDDEDASVAFALGSEYSALGVDWTVILNTIVPILRLILAALEAMSPDDE